MREKKKKVECPVWLTGLAKAEWDRLVSDGVVVSSDHNFTVMAGYCQSYARWRQAEEALEESGTENIRGEASPQIAISNKYFDRMLKSALQLGINTDRPGVSKQTKTARATDQPTNSFFGPIPQLN
jgi:P27 family predicted phage terminase small subunit